MRDRDAIEERVQAAAWIWQDRLEMTWLTINHKFDDRIDGDRTIAETIADWEYRQATIRWNLPTVACLSDEELADTIVHEYVHVLIASLYESLPETLKDRLAKQNEFATENVARAILSAARRPAI